MLKTILITSGKYILLPLLMLLLIILLLSSGYVAYNQLSTAREIAITTEDGIQSLKHIELNNVKQAVSIRGLDKENPVLLFLHGGPGASEMVPVRHHNQALEEHFIVVNWDQRGTGKSFSPNIPEESMNMEQIILDALELTRILKESFDVDRIYLTGHSWGTIIGVHAAQRHPEYYHAFIGIGQAVNFIEAEKLSFEFTLQKAKELQHELALSELEEIGPPPYDKKIWLDNLSKQRKWLFKFGGEVYGETNNTRYLLDLAKLHLFAPEYTITDIIKYLRGSYFSTTLMWTELLKLDLVNQIPRLEIPVYFLQGRHDYVTVSEKVQLYYDVLEAPHKELVWFENSAHSPNFEEPEQFIQVLERIKEETYGEQPNSLMHEL